MLNEFKQFIVPSMNAGDIVLNLVVAFLCGIIIAFVYRKAHRYPGYPVNFVNSLVLLTLLTAIVIMVIGNNLARAFGLVGAMSIIRFRTAVKETQDIVFIFFALSIGMAAGVGYYELAVIGTVVVSALILFFARNPVTGVGKREYLLQLTYLGSDINGNIINILKQYCQIHKTVNVRALADQNTVELAYLVVLKENVTESALASALRKAPGVSDVNLLFDENPV